MKVETEYQFLQRIRKLSPNDQSDEIEKRWSELYGKQQEVIYHHNEQVNETIHRMIAYRKKRRFKTTPEWIAGTLDKMKGLTDEQIVEAILHNIANGYQGFFLPSNFKTKPNERNSIKTGELDAALEASKGRFSY